VVVERSLSSYMLVTFTWACQTKLICRLVEKKDKEGAFKQRDSGCNKRFEGLFNRSNPNEETKNLAREF
jgi:hypothetical protein